MNTKATLFILIVILLLTMGISLYAYNRFAEPVAVHWGPSGAADGFGSRFEGAFLVPIIACGTALLMLALPAIDPLKANIAAFRREYNAFILVFSAFMVYLHGLTILYNLGAIANLNRMLTPGFGLVIFYAGVLLQKAKRNYFIGIRTPWTLNSDTVWNQTHRRGALLFKAAGLISLLGILFPNAAVYLLLFPVLAVSVYLIVYSYVLHRREVHSS